MGFGKGTQPNTRNVALSRVAHVRRVMGMPPAGPTALLNVRLRRNTAVLNFEIVYNNEQYHYYKAVAVFGPPVQRHLFVDLYAGVDRLYAGVNH
jgi:hypothetical protein